MLTLLNILAGIALSFVWNACAHQRIACVRCRDYAAFIGERRQSLPPPCWPASASPDCCRLNCDGAVDHLFAGSGLVATAPALAIMLGADIGTAAAVFLSRDLAVCHRC